MNAAELIENARRFLGCPYVWKGKGKSLWTPRGLELHPWVGQVFDCSGLVACAIKLSGGPDVRATHSAQTMFDQFEVTAGHEPGTLRFYGSSRLQVSHVAICTGRDSSGRITVIEAAGGDSRTTTPLIAVQHGARVREGLEVRRDFLGSRLAP